MFSSLLKKITDAIDGTSQPEGNVNSGGQHGSTSSQYQGSAFNPIGVSTLTADCQDWAHVVNHVFGIADSRDRYVKEQQRRYATSSSRSFVYGEDKSKSATIHEKGGHVGDHEEGVRFRAEASVGFPFPNARLVAYDSIRQIVAVLVDGPHITYSNVSPLQCPAAGALARRATSVANNYGGGSCVYFAAAGPLGGVDEGTLLLKAVPLKEDEDWAEMVFVEGYQTLVIRSSRSLCFVDARSLTGVESAYCRANNISPLKSDGTHGNSRASPFSSAITLSPTVQSDGFSPLLTRLCTSMPLGLGSVAVGTSDGTVLFAPLSPATSGTPMAWRKYSANVKGMLEGSKINALSLAREATRRHFEILGMRAAKRATEKRGEEGGEWDTCATARSSLPSSSGAQGASTASAGPSATMMSDVSSLLEGVQCIVSYPSDPNAFLTSTRNSHGLLKWYVIENRLSAMMLLPHCYTTKRNGSAGMVCHEGVTNPAALGEGFAESYVTAACVTSGGAFVVGLTNTFCIAVWCEKDHKKGSDKSVAPFSFMNLMLSHPLASRISQLPDNQSNSDDDEDIGGTDGDGERNSPMSKLAPSRNVHRVLLSRPEQIFLCTTASLSAFAKQTESSATSADAVIPGGSTEQTQQGANGGTTASSSNASRFLSLFIPSHQVQYSGSDATAAFPTEHCTVMTELLLESSTMNFVTVRHVPIQGTRASLAFTTHTKTRGSRHALMHSYPVQISMCPALANSPWPSERLCGLLIGGGASSPSPSPSDTASRLSVVMSGGLEGGCGLRGSVRGSIVPVGLLTGSPTSPLPPSVEDTASPLAEDGSPASLVSFFMSVVQTRDVELSFRAGGNGLPNTVTIRIRTPIGEGALCAHRVVERLEVREEESAATSRDGAFCTYYNASYRTQPLDGAAVGGELFSCAQGTELSVHRDIVAHRLEGGGGGGETQACTLTSSQLRIFRAHHRRLLYDKLEALLRSNNKSQKSLSYGAKSSGACGYLLAGGSRRPFVENQQHRGCSDRSKPYYSATTDDAGLLGIFHSLYKRSVLDRNNRLCGDEATTSCQSRLLSGLRLYPFSNTCSRIPSTSTVQKLIEHSVPQAKDDVRRGSALVEETVIGSTQPIFGGAIVITLVEVREYILPTVDDGGKGATVQQPTAARCKVTYVLKTLTQRHLPSSACSAEANEDSDADNPEYDTVSRPSLGDGPTQTDAKHNYALYSGSIGVPLWEFFAPTCCAGFHRSLLDDEGYGLLPSPVASAAASRAESEAVKTSAKVPPIPTIVDFKVIYGTMVRAPAVGDKKAAAGAPRRLFSPNEGISLALVLSDNTIIVTSIKDLVIVNEHLALGGEAAQNMQQPPNNTVSYPAFLFPAQTRITSVEVFSVPVVVPTLASSRSRHAQEAQTIPMLSAATSAFAAAHTLVLSVGLGDGSLMLFDTSREVVLGRFEVGHRGCVVAALRAATPANDVYSYSPGESRTDDEAESENSGGPSEALSVASPMIALNTNPFAPTAISRPSALHEAVYECFTLPCYGAIRDASLSSMTSPSLSCPLRPLYSWYPRTALTKIPPQIPIGCIDGDSARPRRGQKGASIGGCSYLRVEMLFAGGMMSLADILKKAAASIVIGAHSSQAQLSPTSLINIHTFFTAQVLDVFGLPLCGLEVGVGVDDKATSPHTSSALLFIRVADTHVMSQHVTAGWVPLDPSRLPHVGGLALTREFDTGLAILSLIPMPAMMGGGKGRSLDDDEEDSSSQRLEAVFTANVGPPAGVRTFNARRVSCVNVRAVGGGGSASPFTFSPELGSNVSIEIVDALDDNIRLFAVDVMPMPLIGGSLPVGGVVSNIVSTAVARRSSRGKGSRSAPSRAKIPQLCSLHDFPLSRSFTTAGYGGAVGAHHRRQVAAIPPTGHQLKGLHELIAAADGANPKALLAVLDNMLHLSVTDSAHCSNAVLFGTLLDPNAEGGSGGGFDARIVCVSLKGIIHSIQLASINGLRSYFNSLALQQTVPPSAQSVAPQQQQVPFPLSTVTVPPPKISSLSLRSLLSVAARHNNLCEKGLSEWSRFVLASNPDGSGGAPQDAAIKEDSSKPSKISFEERMRRIDKGRSPEPSQSSSSARVGTVRASATEASHQATDALNAERTIQNIYRGPRQQLSSSQSSALPSSTKCPYSDFFLPNVVSCFTVLSTSHESHSPDELATVRLHVRTEQHERREDMTVGATGKDTLIDDDDDDDDGLLELAHVFIDRQRPFAFVAFTTETSTVHPYFDTVVDAEEGLYGHPSLMLSTTNAEEEQRSSGGGPHRVEKGIVRQGGPYRSHIAVFDVSIACFEAECGSGGGAAKSSSSSAASPLHPLYVFPIPSSSVPLGHVVTGFDVCWVEGQAHCYLSSAPELTIVGEGVVDLGLGLGNGHVHRRTHRLAHIVLDDGANDFEEADDEDTKTSTATASTATTATQKHKKLIRMIPPTHLVWEESNVLRSLNPFAVCDFVGLSSLRKKELESACLQRMQREFEAAKGGPSSRSHLGRPPAHSKEVLGFTLPQPPSNLSATQKEQGFFKRLITSGYSDQLEKVEKTSLTALAEVDFNAFFTSAQNTAFRNLTPAQRRAMLLDSERKGGTSHTNNNNNSPQSGINETKTLMNENLQLLTERGDKIDRLRLKTREMHDEAATFADLAAQLKAKQRSRWI